jgi:hypothetical protein
LEIGIWSLEFPSITLLHSGRTFATILNVIVVLLLLLTFGGLVIWFWTHTSRKN